MQSFLLKIAARACIFLFPCFTRLSVRQGWSCLSGMALLGLSKAFRLCTCERMWLALQWSLGHDGIPYLQFSCTSCGLAATPLTRLAHLDRSPGCNVRRADKTQHNFPIGTTKPCTVRILMPILLPRICSFSPRSNLLIGLPDKNSGHTETKCVSSRKS